MCGLLSVSLLIGLSSAIASSGVESLPATICSAKSVQVVAHNAETYDRAVSAIREDGRWDVVESGADIVIEFLGGGVWKGGVRLEVQDGKSNQLIYGDHQRTVFWRDTTKSLMRRLLKRCPKGEG